MIDDMLQLLKAIKDKYRIYIFIRVDKEGSSLHERAQEGVKKLVEEGIVLEHRAMYSTTLTG